MLFDHFVAHAHVQSAAVRFIAHGLYVVIDFLFVCARRFFGYGVKALRQVFHGFAQRFGQISAVGLDRYVLTAVQSRFFRERTEYHFGVVYKVVVYLVPFVGLARAEPFYVFRIRIDFFRALAKEQNVRYRFRARRLFERRVRQSDRAQKLGALRNILSCARVELVHCALARDYRHDTARLYLVNGLCEKIVMDLEVVAVICAVRYTVAAERHVAYNDVELVVGEARVLKALYLHVRLRVQFSRDPACKVIQLHAVQSAAVGYLFRHKTEEIARTHGRL